MPIIMKKYEAQNDLYMSKIEEMKEKVRSELMMSVAKCGKGMGFGQLALAFDPN